MNKENTSTYLTKLYTKEFLENLQHEAQHIDLVTYVMSMNKLSFHDAIKQIAFFLKIEPKYTKKRDETDCLKMRFPSETENELHKESFDLLMEKIQSNQT